MKRLWIGIVVGALALAPSLVDAKGVKANRGPAASLSLPHASLSVLPAESALMGARPAASYDPFVVPKTRSCVTLTNPKWASGGSAELCGLASAYDQKVAAYPGIQYATADRWMPPTANPISGRNLTGFGPSCPQTSKSDPTMPIAEQCLYLNVWVPPGPPPASGYPVMVFIYGGAFISGSSSMPVYDGAHFAENKVILVSLNYRLGALGFLVGQKFGANATGNYGIMDQNMALNWVFDNIGKFGGDNGKITIFGESAGAMSVGLHLYSIPSSTTYFQAAIMESNPVGLLYQLSDADGPSAIGNQFLTTLCLGVNPVKCLGKGKFDPRTAPLKNVLKAQGLSLLANALPDVAKGYMGLRGLPFQPVIDKSLIMGQPLNGYAQGTTPKPVVFGVNEDEGTVFAALVAAALPVIPAKDSPPGPMYDGVVNGGFPQGDQPSPTSKMLAADNSRYDGAAPNPPAYKAGSLFYNRFGQAAADIVQDYDFAVANIMMANNGLATGGGATAPTYYAYYFDQAPLIDIYGYWDAKKKKYVVRDHGACAPKGGGNVCHASELPYVFDTWDIAVPREVHLDVPTANQDLAKAMNAAWAAFATDPKNPGPVWTHPYTNSLQNTTGAPAVVFNTTNPSATGTIDPNNVYGIWKGWLSVVPMSAGGGAAQ